MIKLFLLIISLLSTVSSFAQKEDTVSIQQNILEHEQLKQGFIAPAFHNPSLIHYQYTASLSSFNLKGKTEKLYSTTAAEQGDRTHLFNVGAETYIHLTDHSTVWGKAYYENGKIKNVQWNESSDFDIIYPYVSADTIGGDMKSNTYYFNGGYAQRYKNWTFGGEFSYRALMEYRDVDPRPKNTIADLRGKIGLSYHFMSPYAIGIAADAQKYKQNSSIRYYNELGVSKTYHLQGLGISFVRFDGTNTSVNYQGNQWGITANLLPTSVKGGFYANASFHKDFKEKILPLSNSLTLNNTKESLWDIDAGWYSADKQRNQLGVKGIVTWSNRNGSEYYYGDPTGNIYPVIAIKGNFNRTLASYLFTAFYQHNHSECWMIGGSLMAGYSSRKESHKESGNALQCNTIHAQLDFKSIWKWKQQMFKLSAACSYQDCTDAALHIKRTTNTFARQILERNFSFNSSDIVGYSVSAQWSATVRQNKVIYLEANWAQKYYIGYDKGHYVFANLGFAF